MKGHPAIWRLQRAGRLTASSANGAGVWRNGALVRARTCWKESSLRRRRSTRATNQTQWNADKHALAADVKDMHPTGEASVLRYKIRSGAIVVELHQQHRLAGNLTHIVCNGPTSVLIWHKNRFRCAICGAARAQLVAEKAASRHVRSIRPFAA